MPISFIAATERAAATGANSFTLAKPAGITTADTIIVGIQYENAGPPNFAFSSGTAVQLLQDFDNQNNNTGLAVFKITNETAGGNWTITSALLATQWAWAFAVAYSGVDHANIIAGTAYSQSPGGANFNIPAITFSGTNNVALAIIAQQFTAAPRTISPTGTNRANPDSLDCNELSYPSSGSTGVVTVTNSAFVSAIALLVGLPEEQRGDPYTFTAADGSLWSPRWTFAVGSGDIQGNRGRMVTGTGAFDGDAAFIDVGAADGDISVDVEIPTVNAQFSEVRYRFSNVNYDFIRLVLEPHNDIWYIHDFDNDVQQTLRANGSFPFEPGDVVHIKFNGAGSTAQFKLWKNDDREPSAWTASFTTTLGQTNTQFMVRTVTSNLGVAITNFWDNLQVPTAGTATASATAFAAMARVSGRPTAGAATGAGHNALVREQPPTSPPNNEVMLLESGWGKQLEDGSYLQLESGGAGGSANANATAATSTANAFNASARVSSGAEQAAATGSAAPTTSLSAPNAGSATAAGVGFPGSPALRPSAGQAAATGVANGATVSTSAGTNANAEVATAAAQAHDATVRVVTNAGQGAASGAASPPTPSVRPNAAQAAAAGSASALTAAVLSSAGQAAATGAAQAASAAVRAPAGQAAASGSASPTTPVVAPRAGAGAATGTAANATVGAAGLTLANASQAAATGSAFGASVRITPNASAGVSAGTGSDAGEAVRSSAEQAAATALANVAAAWVRSNAGQATASGTANDSLPRIFVAAAAAAAVGTAFTGTASVVTGPATTATATAVAHNAIVSGAGRFFASLAAAIGVAHDGTTNVTTRNAGTALATGVGIDADPNVRPNAGAGVATSTGLSGGTNVSTTAQAAAATASGETAALRIQVFAGFAEGTGVGHEGDVVQLIWVYDEIATIEYVRPETAVFEVSYSKPSTAQRRSVKYTKPKGRQPG